MPVAVYHIEKYLPATGQMRGNIGMVYATHHCGKRDIYLYYNPFDALQCRAKLVTGYLSWYEVEWRRVAGQWFRAVSAA